MIRKTIRIPQEINEQLKEMPNQSKFMREAIEKALKKRVFKVNLECRNQGGRYISTSYITLKALHFDGDLKDQIKGHLTTLNELEQREGCTWCFDRLDEATKEG